MKDCCVFKIGGAPRFVSAVCPLMDESGHILVSKRFSLTMFVAMVMWSRILMSVCFLLFSAGQSSFVYGQSLGTPTSAQDTSKPATFECITNLPGDWMRFGRAAFRTENIPLYAGIAISTVATVIYDHEMYTPVRSWYQSNSTAAFMQDRGVDIGDGKFQFGIAAGFGLYGLITSDNRALRTASQVTEVILAAGTVIQVLKHSTGRESPFLATKPSGRWVLFPNQIEYIKHVPRYDAYPSGHVCTALATLTVVMENYPEATWLPYVGYPAIAWLAVGMVGQGIHWVSDYPLSIAIGYGFAQIVSHKQLFSKKQDEGNHAVTTSFFPYLTADGGSGLTVQVSW